MLKRSVSPDLSGKKLTLIVVALFIMATSIFVHNTVWAQEPNEEVEKALEEADKEVEEAMQKVEKSLSEISPSSEIEIEEKSESAETPFMGVYLDDIDFEDAYEMHYDYNYGVLLDGVVKGGPADKAGLMESDIIMEFDGQKARFEDHLTRLIRSKQVGDKVEVKFFRDEKIMTTTLTLGSRTTKKEREYEEITKEGKVIRKRKLSAGYGGGSWIPVWYQPDLKDINNILSNLGYKKETFSENGFLLQGGGGKGNVGKGWFIGGMGASYENSESTRHNWIHYNNEGILDTANVSRNAKYKINFWGVTLDKRFALSRKFVSSVGFLIGSGKNKITVSQIDKADIDNFDFEDDPSEQMDEFYDYKSTLSLEQKSIVFQPKVMIMWRIKKWLGIRAEAGYMTSYSPNGWKAKRNGKSVKIVNGPDTSMNGYTFTIGPWFGF
ncbi:MAG: PDZ domain-containing protein [Candidatus Cloacimonadota bacterium]|nr:PDZ domain-containing protein [Candidatus Cloacimonadota bacterium]